MSTNVIIVNDRASYADAVKKAATVIESGGIAAIPTETVYGLAVSAEHASAVERLRAVKGRPEEKKFTICVPLKTDVARFVAFMPRTAEKLINAFWPGPSDAGASVEIRRHGGHPHAGALDHPRYTAQDRYDRSHPQCQPQRPRTRRNGRTGPRILRRKD